MLRFCQVLYHVRHLVLRCFPELANDWCHIHVDEQLSQNRVNIGNINKYTLISERLEQYKILQSKMYFNLFFVIISSGIYLNLDMQIGIYATFMFATFIFQGFYHYSELHKLKEGNDVNARFLQDKYFYFRLKTIYKRLHCINESVKYIPLTQCPLFLSI